MKSKFFNFLSVSLASSILLAPNSPALSLGTEPHRNIKQIQPTVEQSRESCLGVNSQGTQHQGLTQGGKPTQTGQSQPAHPLAATSQTINSSQPNSATHTAQLSNTIGGIFVTLLFLSYILVGLQYRKYRIHRAAMLLQQIETLERIWRMNPRQR